MFLDKFITQSEIHVRMYEHLMPADEVSTIPYNADVVTMSVPKSGTNLITKCLQLLLGRKVYQGHLQFQSNNTYLKEHTEIKVIIPMRDPRDVIVSGVYHQDKHWLDSVPERMYRHYYNPKDPINALSCAFTKDFMADWRKKSLSEKITMQIDPEIIPPISPYYDYDLLVDFVNSRPNVLVVRFENLIGKKGGGNDELQKDEIKKIALFLGITFDDDIYQYVRNNLWGESPTFRTGLIGSWKRDFDETHVELFKKVAGHLLIQLGYESDMEWGLDEIQAHKNNPTLAL